MSGELTTCSYSARLAYARDVGVLIHLRLRWGHTINYGDRFTVELRLVSFHFFIPWVNCSPGRARNGLAFGSLLLLESKGCRVFPLLLLHPTVNAFCHVFSLCVFLCLFVLDHFCLLPLLGLLSVASSGSSRCLCFVCFPYLMSAYCASLFSLCFIDFYVCYTFILLSSPPGFWINASYFLYTALYELV